MDPGRQKVLKAQQHKKKPPKRTRKPLTQPDSASVNLLKTKIRDTQRVLEHASSSLPLEVRIEKERALAGYRQDLEKAENEKERQRMISRYHMVRFFERQKATRALKKLRIQLDSTTPNTPGHDTVARQVHIVEVDLNYTLYHPLEEKYIGIYPRQETSKAQDTPDVEANTSSHIRESKPAMWTVVEVCMANGTLEALRDGKLQTTVAMHLGPQRAAIKKSHRNNYRSAEKIKAKTYPDAMVVDKEDGDSDGGFFEE